MPYFILITRPLHTQRTIRRMTACAWKRTIQVHLLFQLEFSLGLKRGSCCSIFSFVDHCLSLYCLLSLIISMVRYIYGTLYLWYVQSFVFISNESYLLLGSEILVHSAAKHSIVVQPGPISSTKLTG
jgi:hypothetical protein